MEERGDIVNGSKLGKLRERLKKINQRNKTSSKVMTQSSSTKKKVEYERFGVPIHKTINQVKEYQKLEELENSKKEELEKQLKITPSSKKYIVSHKKGIPEQKMSPSSSKNSKIANSQKIENHNEKSPEKNKLQELKIPPVPSLLSSPTKENNKKEQKKVEEQITKEKQLNDQKDLILKKIKNKLKKELNELEVIESELYLINKGQIDYQTKEKIEEERKKLMELIEKIKKLKEQFQIFKENSYLEDIIWLNDECLMDDIIKYKELATLEDKENIKKHYQLFEEYKSLYIKLEETEKTNQKLDEQNKQKMELKKEQDKSYDAYVENTKEFQKIGLKMDKFLIKQENNMNKLASQIEKITSREVIEKQIKNLDKLLYYDAKYFFALLLTPLKGVFPSIAMNAVATKKMVDNIRKTVHIEEIKKTIYEAPDYLAELDYTLYSLADIGMMLDSNIDRLKSLESEIKTKFQNYDPEKTEQILKNITKMRKILDNNRYKLEKVKTSVYGNIKKNEKVKKRVKELNK